MDTEIHFTNGVRSAAFTPLHRANAKSVLKSTELSALKRRRVPGSAGVSPACSGFRLPTGRRDAGAPWSLAEGEKNGGIVLNLCPRSKTEV
jgi:hypothetical protein